MMRGLVVVPVLPHRTRTEFRHFVDFLVVGAHPEGGRNDEKLVELLEKFCFAAVHLDQRTVRANMLHRRHGRASHAGGTTTATFGTRTGDGIRRKRVVPGVALYVALSPLDWLEVMHHSSRVGLWRHQSNLSVKQSRVRTHTAFVQDISLIAQFLDQARIVFERGSGEVEKSLGGGEVSEAIVQGARHLVTTTATCADGEVALVDVRVDATLAHRPTRITRRIREGIFDQCFFCQLQVKVRNILHNRIRHHHICEGSDHAVSVSWRSPRRQPASFLVRIQPTLHDVAQVIGVDQRQQRIHCAERVPKSIICDERSGMHLTMRVVRRIMHHIAL
mmetsp:Transcript_15703/g.27611  ORF Transcript_15703/g.27611 Transcript_15703/m.27611 type:complete len:333 (+) Transcript_15703:1487-2485(+)